MKRKPGRTPDRISRLRCVLLVLVAILLLAGVALAAGAPRIVRKVIAAGGGRVEVSGQALSGTLGQAVVGVAGSGTDRLCAGFWCRSGEDHPYATYLPLVLRDY